MDAAQTNPGRRITDIPASGGSAGFVETPTEIRAQALRFIGLTALIEGVLILTRWVLFPGLTEMASQTRAVAVTGSVGLDLTWVAVYCVAAACLLLGRFSARTTIHATLVLVVASATIAVIRRGFGVDPGPGGAALATMLIAHTAGASMLPWSPRQAVSVALIWIVLSGGSHAFFEPAVKTALGASLFATAAVTVPGTMIAFFRSSRLNDRFAVRTLEDRYARVREELSAARQIHEGAFPQPRYSGRLRFAYEYRPMSQIGGDYVFASVDRPTDPDSPITLVLLDVTGHGIPAALTVNRLQGELARLVAEHPGLGAGSVLEQLNRYVYLTLAEQSVFVTAVAIRAETGRPGVVEIANAGHPPVLIRRSGGAIEMVGATTTVLGAQEPDEYRARPITLPIDAGDSVIAFTDGVTESRANDGRMFGVEGVRAVVDAGRPDPSRRWPEIIARAVERHRPANPTDDTLIIELFCVGTGEAR